MSSTMSLNTRVQIVSKSGNKETITARELLARGSGATFEAFQMFDEYDGLAKAFDAEQKTLVEDREDFLPDGAHLLPQDYQDFLYGWNKQITATAGWWNGPQRAAFWKSNPESKSQFMREHKIFRERYAAEVQTLKDYQATYIADSDGVKLSILPPISTAIEEQPEVPQSLQAPVKLQAIPDVLSVAAQEQPDAGGEGPKRPRKPIYTNNRWPSPIAKVFVQYIRGRNAWNISRWSRRYGGVWGDPLFNVLWRHAGNTEFKLTHDNCMRYLALRMRITVGMLMEKTPHEVHATLIGQHSGVRGFYTKRLGY